MTRLAFRFRHAAGISLLLLASSALTAAAQAPSPPDFSSNGVSWIAVNADYVEGPSGPSPVRQDPAHPFVPNGQGKQPTFRIADLSNPNIKQWAKDRMRRDNDAVLAGGIAYTARSSCMPAGIPDFMMFIIEPVYIIQSPKEVLMIYSGDQQLRRIYLDVPHSANPKPSWYGESVGHYEGDTLVVDTIGLNDKSYIDNYRTPHTDKLHVTERWKLVNNGGQLEVAMTIDDPDTFNQPFQEIQRYRRVDRGPLDEEYCAENNAIVFDYHIPIASKPDF